MDISIYGYMYMYVCICLYVYVYVYIYVCIYIYVYVSDVTISFFQDFQVIPHYAFSYSRYLPLLVVFKSLFLALPYGVFEYETFFYICFII